MAVHDRVRHGYVGRMGQIERTVPIGVTHVFVVQPKVVVPPLVGQRIAATPPVFVVVHEVVVDALTLAIGKDVAHVHVHTRNGVAAHLRTGPAAGRPHNVGRGQIAAGGVEGNRAQFARAVGRFVDGVGEVADEAFVGGAGCARGRVSVEGNVDVDDRRPGSGRLPIDDKDVLSHVRIAAHQVARLGEKGHVAPIGRNGRVGRRAICFAA